MSDRMRVVVEGQDNASDDLRRVGQSATQMGRDVERAGQQAERGFRGVGDAATQTERTWDRLSRTGAALGGTAAALAGVLSDAARAAAEEEVVFRRLETAVEATGVAFDDLSPAIDAAIAGAEDLSFADDQAAAALTNLTSITGNAQEALNLLGLAMDVARGRGISLADAATLVGRAAEGQTQQLARLGIVLQEGATAQEALAALQQRYAGQSEAYADTTQGAIDRVKNSFDNWIESLGASTGELQTVLALLPGLSVAVTGIGTAAGAAAPLLASFALALGPVGLGALAVGGAIALIELARNTEDYSVSAEEATRNTESLNAALATLAQSGVDQASYDRARALAEEALAVQVLTTETATATNAWDAYLLSIESSPETFVQIRDIMEEFALTGDQLNEVLADQATILSATGDSAEYARRLLHEANQEYLNGRITAEQYAARVDFLATNIDNLGTTTDYATGRTGELEAAYDSLNGVFARWVDIADEGGDVARDLAEAQREVNQGLAEAARLNADADAARSAAQASGQAELDQQRARAQARRDEAAAAYEQEQALLAAAVATSAVIVPLEEAAAAMGGVRTGSLLTADGVASLSDQMLFQIGVAADLAAAQDDLNTQLSFYRGAVSDMDAAYAVLQERIAAGETLNQEQLDFIAEYEAEAAGLSRTIDDLVVEQGILAQAQIDNAQAQEDLTAAMGDTNTALTELVEPLTLIAQALAELAGVDLGNLAPPDGAAEAWTDVAGAIERATAAARYASAPAPTLTPPLPAAPANQAPPSQDTLGPETVATVTTRTIEFLVDYDDVRVAVLESDQLLDALVGESRIVEIEGDGSDAVAVIKDLEGDVQAVVTGEYVVVIEGNADGALSETEAVELALAAIDGDTSTVYVAGDASPFRAEVAGINGRVVGTAYIQLVGIGGPGGELTPYAGGGVVEAANGRVVRAGEIGPELVYPPGGRPYLVAQDGLAVMQAGSFVSTAAATRARGASVGGGGIHIHFHGPVYGIEELEDRLARILDGGLAQAIEDRYREIGWPMAG